MTEAVRKQDGFIIVAVLWMVAALGVLAAIFTRFALTTAIATTVHEDRLQAEAMMQAGVELAALQITATDSKARPGGNSAAASPDIVPGQSAGQSSQAAASLGASKRPTKGAFSFRLGRAAATVEYRTEAARIDLNAASKESFAALFRTFGAKPDDANDYADRILGWRKKADGTGENAEATDYRVAGLNYGPRQAPFQSVSELWLVRGIPTVFKERMLPFVTVYSGQTQVDPENAAPEVIAAMPNMTPERLGTVLQQRAAPQGGGDIPGGQDPASSLAQSQSGSKAYRLTMRVTLEKGRNVAAEMVILVPEEAGDEPYRTLFWRDDFDGWR